MRIGLHYHNFPPAAPEVLKQLKTTVDLVLDNDASYYIPQYDDGLKEWVIRVYSNDSMGTDAVVWGDRCANVLKEWRLWAIMHGTDPDRFMVQIANELNLGLEHNNDPVPWDTQEKFDQILSWMVRVCQRIKWHGPELRVVAPCDSPGHQDVDLNQYIFQYAPLLPYIDVFGYHAYAESLAEHGGYDAEGWWYTHRRPAAVRAMLDQMGWNRARMPIYILETNRKDVEQGDIIGELERWIAWLDPMGEDFDAVEAVVFFIWSSGDKGAFGTMELSDVMNEAREVGNVSRFNQLVYTHTYITDPAPPGYTQIPTGEIPVTTVPPVSPWTGETKILMAGVPASLAQAQAKYPGLQIKNGQHIVVDTLIEETSGGVVLSAQGPPEFTITLHPGNLQDINARSGPGGASIVMGNESQGPKSSTWVGPWTAVCGDAEVVHLGMVDFHHHFRVIFGIRPADPVSPPPDEPVEPETPSPSPVDRSPGGGSWAAYRVYIDWAAARWDKREDHTSLADFRKHLEKLAELYGLPDPEDVQKYGYPL